MNKESWFREYERLYNEREVGERFETDIELAELAFELSADSVEGLDNV